MNSSQNEAIFVSTETSFKTTEVMQCFAIIAYSLICYNSVLCYGYFDNYNYTTNVYYMSSESKQSLDILIN